MRKKLNLYFLFLCLVSVFLISGCSKKEIEMGDEKEEILVYTSFYTMNDFANKIGGEKLKIRNLVPSGGEPHDWEPSASDIAGLEAADVLIYSGAGMEPWLDKIISSLGNQELMFVNTSVDIAYLGVEDHDGHNSDFEYDPHIWLNPLNAKKQMERIKDAFVEIDPENAIYFEEQFNRNARELDKLDEEYKQASSYFVKRDIIVAHKAFGYLCTAYGLNQVAIEGLSADSEPSPARMTEIIKFAKENDIKYIFFEELVSPKVAETIAKEVGAKTAVLNPIEGISKEDVESGRDYFSIMRENLEALKMALGEEESR